MVAVAAAVKLGGARTPDVATLTRTHLQEAARYKPLTFREAVVDDAVAWEIAEADAERLAAVLQTLMRERFTLWLAYYDTDADAQARTRADAIARDQALLGRARDALAQWGDSEFRERVFRVWQLDSAVPYRFLPPLTHDELQRRIYPNGIAYMHSAREQRWSQTERLAVRAGADWQKVRALIEPAVVEREKALERYGTAPPGELPELLAQMKAARARGRAALQGVVPDDVADALVASAFIGVPDTERGEAQIDECALVVFGS